MARRRPASKPFRSSPTLFSRYARVSRLAEVNEKGKTSWVTVVPHRPCRHICRSAVLMHLIERAYGGVVFDDHVARKRGAVGEDACVSDLAVVSDMGVGHDEASAAHPRGTSSSCGSARNGHAFADQLSSPSVTPVGSPLYFRSCGATPTQAKEKNRLRAPAVRWPSRTTCETSSQSSPSATFGPIVE